MDRLTTNKDVSEMSMIELAYNSCYAKDEKARVRDYENDFDARELTIELLEKYADIPNEFTCDEDFDDFMLDSLQYGMDNIQGLIAVFYRNLWSMADLYEKLKHYEDLEEQGKLLKLPCTVGDTLFVLTEDSPIGIEETKCKSIVFNSKNNFIVYAPCQYDDWGRAKWRFKKSHFGKTVFLTKEEAEAALKEMSEE